MGKFEKLSWAKNKTFYIAASVAIVLGLGGGAVFAYREYQVKKITQQKEQEVKSAIKEGGEATKDPAKTEEGSADQNTDANKTDDQTKPADQNQADANATATPAPAATAPKTTYIAPKTTYTAPKVTTAPAPTYSAPAINTVAGAQVYVENRIFALVNAERASKGLGALRYQSQIGTAADIRASEEAILSFVGTDHTRPNGTSFSTVFAQVGYTGYTMVGENLAWGYMPQFAFNQTNLDNLAQKIFTQWKNSPGHYAAMTRPEYNQTGVGVVIKLVNGRLYYFATQEFGRRAY